MPDVILTVYAFHRALESIHSWMENAEAPNAALNSLALNDLVASAGNGGFFLK